MLIRLCGVDQVLALIKFEYSPLSGSTYHSVRIHRSMQTSDLFGQPNPSSQRLLRLYDGPAMTLGAAPGEAPARVRLRG